MWLKKYNTNEGERETEEVTRTTAENIVPVTSYSYFFDFASFLCIANTVKETEK